MIVPFADVNSPLVPVLSICSKMRVIQFLRKNGDEWIATADGWLTNKEILRRFAPLIRKHASLIVRP